MAKPPTDSPKVFEMLNDTRKLGEDLRSISKSISNTYTRLPWFVNTVLIQKRLSMKIDDCLQLKNNTFEIIQEIITTNSDQEWYTHLLDFINEDMERIYNILTMLRDKTPVLIETNNDIESDQDVLILLKELESRAIGLTSTSVSAIHMKITRV
jgi:predicted transcriptional regulator